MVTGLPTAPRALRSSQATLARGTVGNPQLQGLYLENRNTCPNKQGHRSLSDLLYPYT
jgi:hypothetical protein